MEAAGVGEVIASSFDNPASQHVAVAELTLERARRRVELGEDVVLIVDSLTRLARAYNTVEKGTGRTLSGGLDAQSLEKPKRFLGSARKVDPAQGGGSLTIIATALVDTGSKMDQVIFEEFKGTGNSELVLSRELAERRIFPAIDLVASATRREELLLDPETLEASHALRQRIAGMTPINAMNDLLVDLRRHPTNGELVSTLNAEAAAPRPGRTGGPLPRQPRPPGGPPPLSPATRADAGTEGPVPAGSSTAPHCPPVRRGGVGGGWGTAGVVRCAVGPAWAGLRRGAGYAPSLRSISACGSQRPRTITPARFVVFLMSASGSASSRTRSARLPRSIVPVSRSVPK